MLDCLKNRKINWDCSVLLRAFPVSLATVCSFTHRMPGFHLLCFLDQRTQC